MILVDANVLLYAVNEQAEHHERSRRWLDSALSGQETVGFAWIAILAFVRLSTKPGLFPHPLEMSQALQVVDDWLSSPAAVVLSPGSGHLVTLRELLPDGRTAGNIVNDAHLAALAVEHGCEVVTFDRDFARFSGIRARVP